MSPNSNALIWLWCAVSIGCAIASLPGTIELLLLSVAGILPDRRRVSKSVNPLRRVAIVVPAHNEAANISDCIRSLQGVDKCSIPCEVVVVADNCSDDTATIAENNGARVLIRNDSARRGKGYALDFSFGRLLKENFDAFLIVDADTQVAGNFVQTASEMLSSGADAVQARYLVRNAAESMRTRLMNVAFLAFNVLRPRGRDRMQLSCGIYGNGFGLSRRTLESVPYLADSVVEDLEYHISLVRAGKRVQFADSTWVSSAMPTQGKGVETQRSRWEGGRFRIMRERVPGLFGDVLRGNLGSLEPLGDLLLLPLAFHVTLLAIAASAPYAPSRFIGLAGIAVVLIHLFAAIAVGNGSWRDVASLFAAPFYIGWKLIMLPTLIRSSRGDTNWVRTERKAVEKPNV